MSSGWVEALIDAARNRDLRPEEHQVLANWHTPEVRRAWARRPDTPQQLLAERIRVEHDPSVLGVLLGQLDRVDEQTLDIAVRRGREPAYALVFAANCPDHLSARILRHLRHSDRGWLEDRLEGSRLNELAGREETLEFLAGTLSLEVLGSVLGHATSARVQNAVLARLASLHPDAPTTTQMYARAAKHSFEAEQQGRFEQLLAKQSSATYEAALNARGIRQLQGDEQKRAVERAELRQDLQRRASEGELEQVVTELQELYLKSQADARVATDVALDLITRRNPEIPLELGAQLLPMLGMNRVRDWVKGVTAAHVRPNPANDPGLVEVVFALDKLPNSYSNEVGNLLENLGKYRWDILQQALITVGPARSNKIREAALKAAVRPAQLRWLLEEQGVHPKTIAAHIACDLELLLDLPATVTLSGKTTAQQILEHALKTLPAERMETLDRLAEEWTGSTRSLVETAGTV